MDSDTTKKKPLLSFNFKSKVVDVTPRILEVVHKTAGPQAQSPAEEQLVTFKVLENKARGDCLFITISQFLQNRSDTITNEPFNTTSETIRQECVQYITRPDREDSSKFSNWRRFRLDILINLKCQNSFFQFYNPERNVQDDDEFEVEARKQYAKYMRTPGNFGTATELTAAMEIYKFSVTMIQQQEDNLHYFDIYHLHKDDFTSRAYILFTGDPSHGHFELLELQHRSQYANFPKLIANMYCVTEYTPDGHKITIEPVLNRVKAKPGVPPKSLKRKLDCLEREAATPVPGHDLYEAEERNQGGVLKSALNLHPLECLSHMKHWNTELSKLRDEFGSSKGKRVRVYDGIWRSSLLKIGDFHTVFISFDPMACSEYSVANYDVNYVVCDENPIVVRIRVADCCENNMKTISEEKNGPFQILEGTIYALENPNEDNRAVVRVFWEARKKNSRYFCNVT